MMATKKQKNLKRWIVTIPIAGTSTVEVCAETREEAIELAMEDPAEGDVMWDAFKVLVQGNCLNAPQNEIEAEEA